MFSLEVVDLGVVPYRTAWEEQKRRQAELIRGVGHPIILLCSHPDVITVGKSRNRQAIIATEELLSQRNVETIEVERGGDVTFHSPEQLTGYPIIALADTKKDVGWYMRSLEEVIIKTISHFDVLGERIPGKTGVWVMRENTHRKIASIGVKMSRWVTMHGFSINVLADKGGFSLIIPCGLNGVEVTSIEQESKARPSTKEVGTIAADEFKKIFEYTKF